jgi:hypothetical protein
MKATLLLISSLIFFFTFSSLSEASAQQIYVDEDDSKSKLMSVVYGFNFMGIASGSGHGVNLNPGLYYRFKRNALSFGPNVQQENMNVSGIQSSYHHYLAANSRDMLLYYHVNMIYHVKANLGPVSSDQYQSLHGAPPGFSYNTFEHYMGFGIKKLMSDNIHVDGGIGVGAYYTMNSSEMVSRPPFRADNDFSLMIRLGLSYDLKKKKLSSK